MGASARREVTVHVPGLLGPWPTALAGEVSRGLVLPGLVGLLAGARRAGTVGARRGAVRIGRPRSGGAGEAESPERLAFGVFGHPSKEGDVPAAALMWEKDAAAADAEARRGLQAEGSPSTAPLRAPGPVRSRGKGARDTGEAGGRGPSPIGAAAGAGPAAGFVLRADPVHLRAGLDEVRLFDSSHFVLTREAAEAMAGALDRHFAAEGLRFEALHPTRWYAWIERPPDARFCPPGGVAVRGAGGGLPAGNEGSVWRRRMNEAQMVLHVHPANEVREARGELPINSVWFWGTGALEARPRVRFREVRTDDPLVRALAEHGGARVRGLDEEGPGGAGDVPGACLIAPGSGFHRAVLGRDVEAWRRALCGAEERWFGPLFERVKAGDVRKVTIDAGLRVGEAVFEVKGRRVRGPAVPDPGAWLAARLASGGV